MKFMLNGALVFAMIFCGSVALRSQRLDIGTSATQTRPGPSSSSQSTGGGLPIPPLPTLQSFGLQLKPLDLLSRMPFPQLNTFLEPTLRNRFSFEQVPFAIDPILTQIKTPHQPRFLLPRRTTYSELFLLRLRRLLPLNLMAINKVPMQQNETGRHVLPAR
jgi:hypothetical protein